ncbi:MAG: hypothetical protein ABJZ55_20980 [Fuerstiella sp.]
MASVLAFSSASTLWTPYEKQLTKLPAERNASKPPDASSPLQSAQHITPVKPV